MIKFFIVFFLITIFDYIEMIKQKRKRDLYVYIIITIIVIILGIITYQENLTTNLTKILFDIFNIKEM